MNRHVSPKELEEDNSKRLSPPRTYTSNKSALSPARPARPTSPARPASPPRGSIVQQPYMVRNIKGNIGSQSAPVAPVVNLSPPVSFPPPKQKFICPKKGFWAENILFKFIITCIIIPSGVGVGIYFLLKKLNELLFQKPSGAGTIISTIFFSLGVAVLTWYLTPKTCSELEGKYEDEQQFRVKGGNRYNMKNIKRNSRRNTRRKSKKNTRLARKYQKKYNKTNFRFLNSIMRFL